MELNEARFRVEYHATLEKGRNKAWNDRHIKKTQFFIGNNVIFYDSKLLNHPRKLHMHSLGPFFNVEIRDSIFVNLT